MRPDITTQARELEIHFISEPARRISMLEEELYFYIQANDLDISKGLLDLWKNQPISATNRVWLDDYMNRLDDAAIVKQDLATNNLKNNNIKKENYHGSTKTV